MAGKLKLFCSMTSLLLIFSLSGCSRSGDKYPVLGRDSVKGVGILENHSEALERWAERGIKNAVLINIDTHDDIRRISREKIRILKKLYTDGDIKSMKQSHDIGDESLYHIGNFIYAAATLGIISKVYWVIPFAHFSYPDTEERLRLFLKTYSFTDDDLRSFHMENGCYRGIIDGIPLSVCGIEQLPDIGKPVLLSIDLDYFPPFPVEYKESLLGGVKMIFDALASKSYMIRDAVIAYSVKTGHTRAFHAWLADVVKGVLENPEVLYKESPPALWAVYQQSEFMQREEQYKGMVHYLLPLLKQYANNPALLMYVASAYANLGNYSRSVRAGEIACMENRYYCYGLTEIGYFLLKDGKVDEAEKYFVSAERLRPDSIHRWSYMGLALMNKGKVKESLKYLLRVERENGAYPFALFVAQAYYRLGDEERAGDFFRKAMNRLINDRYAGVRYKAEVRAIKEALEFFKKAKDTNYVKFIRSSEKVKDIIK